MCIEKMIFCLLYLFVIQISAQKWETQNGRVTFALRSVCFVDSLYGWAAGDSDTIIYTKDGGKNWFYQVPSNKVKNISKIQFVSRSIGYIIGRSGLILSTKDGGMNWNASYILPDSSNISYGKGCFINENEGWVPGSKEGRNYSIGLIMHTADGGKTWEKQLEIISYNQFEAKYFSNVKFLNDKIGFAIAGDYFDNFSSTYVFKTEDGGLRWENVGVINGIPADNLEIANKDTLWCSWGGFATSVDGGRNWIKYSNHYSTVLINAIQPRNGTSGWMSYNDFVAKDRRIFYTSDIGNSWKEEIRLEQVVLAMSYTHGYLWIVGTKGLIMKRNPLISSVVTNDIIPSSFNLYQNYPNPFNNSTIIRFDLLRDSEVDISIYNYIGQTIRTYTFSSLSAGSHFVEWDGKNKQGKQVPSAFYICKMDVKNEARQNFSKTIKIIYLK